MIEIILMMQYDDSNGVIVTDKINLPYRWIKRAGIFHHLTSQNILYSTHMNDLTQGYFGKEGMLAYVKSGVHLSRKRACFVNIKEWQDQLGVIYVIFC
jgi:hypothetical protein